MKLEPFLCMAGTEISNNARTFTYVTNLGLPHAIVSMTCPCDVYNEGYFDPISDPAPWYDSTRPESADFLGFYAHTITLEPVIGRSTNPRANGGSVIGPNRLTHRLMPVTGIMIARSALGMAYGERWLSEVLRGGVCADGCASDDVEFLPACPEPGYDEERYFRYLHSAGVIDGPIFQQAEGVSSECYVQEAAFTIASQWPWLYHPETVCAEGETLDAGLSPDCLFTTPEWMGDGTFYIEIEADDTLDPLGKITIAGQVSFDGDCPVGEPANAAEPCFKYVVADGALFPGDKLIIDGTRRQVLYYDATEKKTRGGLFLLEFEGPFTWPDVPPCTSVCLTVTMNANYSGDSSALVNIYTYLREI